MATKKKTSFPVIPVNQPEGKIFTVRGQRVMIDYDLAELYGTETRTLKQAVKRNIERFPNSFMFQLTKEEAVDIRSQSVILNKPASEAGEPRSQSVILKGKGHNIKYLPSAFTEHGVLMLANVLKSERAISVSIHIIEAFVRLKQVVISHVDLEKKIAEIEAKLSGHDEQFKIFQELVLPLLDLNISRGRKIGFNPKDD